MKLKEDIQRLQKENENLKEVNSKLKQEVVSLKYALGNYRFDIDKYNEKDDDITFYTGFPDYQALIICYKSIEQASSNIVYEHKRTSSVYSCHAPVGVV